MTENLRSLFASVDKIDAQALKSAESALAYKEKVIDKLTKENNDYIVHEPDGRTYKLKPATSQFLEDLNCGKKFEVVRPVGGIILKRKPI